MDGKLFASQLRAGDMVYINGRVQVVLRDAEGRGRGTVALLIAKPDDRDVS